MSYIDLVFIEADYDENKISYYKDHMEVVVNGKTNVCMIYKSNVVKFGVPNQEHLLDILDGYEDYGFDPPALENALELSVQQKEGCDINS